MDTDRDTITEEVLDSEAKETPMPQTTDYNRIKEWLLPKLDTKGVSVEQFARSVGISRAALYFYLVDKHRPTEQVMAQICHVLEVPFEEGLRQYTPKKIGRPKGTGSGLREVHARA